MQWENAAMEQPSTDSDVLCYLADGSYMVGNYSPSRRRWVGMPLPVLLWTNIESPAAEDINRAASLVG